MMLDYYISMGSLAAGFITNSPTLKAIPTAMTVVGNFCPKFYPVGLLTSNKLKGEQKFHEIKKMILDVGNDLNISHPERVVLRVTSLMRGNACMIGNMNSFGGPVLCLSREFYNFRSSATDAPSSLFKNLSNDPLALAKAIDQLQSSEKNALKDELTANSGSLSEEELKWVIAHELGHAKLHHGLQISGAARLLLIVAKVTLMAAFVFGFLNTTFVLGMTFLLHYATKAVIRRFESEADIQASTLEKYRPGMTTYFKTNLAARLLKEMDKTGQSAEQRVQKMLNSWDIRTTHPNDAKRLLACTGLQTNSHPPAISWAGIALTCLGIFAIVDSSFKHYEAIFPRKLALEVI